MDDSRILSAIGLCVKAHKLIVGTDLVCEGLRHQGPNRIFLVVEAGDTSPATHKKITDKCRYYNVCKFRLETDAVGLAHAVGKSGSTGGVGIADKSLSTVVKNALEKQSYVPDVLPGDKN